MITNLALGGAQKNTLYSVRKLRDWGWDASVVSGLGPTDSLATLEGACEQYDLPLKVEPHLVRKISPVQDALCLASLTRLFRGEEFDIVHTHGSKAGIIGRLAAAAAGVPTVIHTVHGWGFHDYQPRAMKSVFVNSERAVAPLTHRLISVSQRGMNDGIEAGIGSPKLYSVIRSGIELTEFEGSRGKSDAQRRALGIPEGAAVVGTVTRLCAQKDPITFVRAASLIAEQHPHAFFLMVGDGTLRESLQTEVERLGLKSRFLITGYRQDVADCLATMDVFVLTSLWEGLPRAVVEAIAAGIPVVATDAGGTRELVQTGQTGVLVDRRDHKKVATEVAAILSAPEDQTPLVRAAHQKLRPDFCRDQMVREIQNIYQEVHVGRSVTAPPPRSSKQVVLYLITDLNLGGAQVQLQHLIAGLNRTRFSPVVACLHGGKGRIAEAIRRLNVPVVDLNLTQKHRVDRVGGLVGLLRQVRPTILHSFLFHADTLARTVGRIMRVPVIITSRRNLEIGGEHRERVRRLTRTWDSCVVAVCDAARHAEIERTGQASEKVVTIRNGIQPRSSALRRSPRARSPLAEKYRRESGAVSDSPLYGFVGRLVENKGLDSLLVAFRQVRQSNPRARLALIGEGQQRGQLQEHCRDAGLEQHVSFPGERDDVSDWLGALDVFVLPSQTEGISNALLEAMDASLPIVATRVGGTPEVVEDGKTGYLVAPGDTRALRGAMDALGASQETRMSLGEAGRTRIASEFTMSRAVRETEELYDRLLESSAVTRHGGGPLV